MATTRDYTDYLNDQVDIAPVNSQEELQASEIVESLFVQHGLETQVEEFDAPVFAGLSTRIYMIVLFLGMLLAGFIGTPVSIVGLVLVAVSFVLLVLARNDNDVLAAIGPQARSQNVIGVHRATGPNVIKGNRPIVIVAHYDTPRENFLYNRQLAKWQPIIKRLAWPLSIAVVVLTLMQVIPFLPVIVRRVFWVLGVLAALPLLLLGASSVYERFAPCTTGANDNKASVAAMLGVLDMVRPGPDDAKRWASSHPKSVRRSLEEELEDEIYGDEWDDEYEDSEYAEDEYAVEESYAEEPQAYADDEQYPYEEDEGYAEEDSAGEESFVEEESYDGQDELSEEAVADLEDEEPAEGYDEDEDYLDEEYLSDEGYEEASDEPVGHAYMPAAADEGFVDEYRFEAPSTVRRGASVLESLQVLPETCEIVYENLIPREEAIERIGGILPEQVEVEEVAGAGSEALDQAKRVAGRVGKTLGGALFAARDWAQRVFDRIGELFVSVKERFGKDHNLPEIDKAGESPATREDYSEYTNEYVEDYPADDDQVEEDYLDAGEEEEYLDDSYAEDEYIEDEQIDEDLESEDEGVDDSLESVDEDYQDAGYLEDEEYLDDEYLEDDEYLDDEFESEPVEEYLGDEMEATPSEDDLVEDEPAVAEDLNVVAAPVPMPTFEPEDEVPVADVDERSDEVVEEQLANADEQLADVEEEVAAEPEPPVENGFEAEALDQYQDADEAPIEDEAEPQITSEVTAGFDAYVPEDKYRDVIEPIDDFAEIPLADFELLDEYEEDLEGVVPTGAYADVEDDLPYEQESELSYGGFEVPTIDEPAAELPVDESMDLHEETDLSSQSTGQLPRVNVAVSVSAEELAEQENIDAEADAEAAVASLWVPAELASETVEETVTAVDEPEPASALPRDYIETDIDALTLDEPDGVESYVEELAEDVPEAPSVAEAASEPSYIFDAADDEQPAAIDSDGYEPEQEAPFDGYDYRENPASLDVDEPASFTPLDLTEHEEPVDFDRVCDDRQEPAREVIDADPWGPYLDVVDAEFEVLDDEVDEAASGSVPVEVVDVPSMGLGYEIPGLTPTDDLFGHTQLDETDALNVADAMPIEQEEPAATSAGYEPDDEVAYAPVAPSPEPEASVFSVPEDRLDDAAVDEIYESVVEPTPVQVATPPVEDASSILHAMFASAPEQRRYEPPRSTDVLHEMFATRPSAMPEEPVVADDTFGAEAHDDWASMSAVQDAQEEEPWAAEAQQDEAQPPVAVVEQPAMTTVDDLEDEPAPLDEVMPTPEEPAQAEASDEAEQYPMIEDDIADLAPATDEPVEQFEPPVDVVVADDEPVAEAELASTEAFDAEQSVETGAEPAWEPEESAAAYDDSPVEEIVEDQTVDVFEAPQAEEDQPEMAEPTVDAAQEAEPLEEFVPEMAGEADDLASIDELDDVDELTVLEDEGESQPDPYATQLMDGLVFSTEEDVSDDELADKDVTGLTTFSAEAEADVEDFLPVSDERIPKPRAVDDPDWGKSSFKPATVSVGRRAMLLDLPDPSVISVDPLDASNSGAFAKPSTASAQDSAAMRSVEAQRRLDALRRVPSPLDEPTGPTPKIEPEPVEEPQATVTEEEDSGLPRYNKGKNIGSRTPKKNAKRKMRFGHRRKENTEQVESMGEWLGLDDDYDAKKDGRQIGSWDNFDDDGKRGKWKGGATYRAGLRDDDYYDDAEPLTGEPNFDELDMAPAYATEGGQMMDETEQNALDDESMTELREAVLRLGDDDLIAHDVWFVGVGSSALDHAGMRAFLDEHRRDIRGAFLVNIDSVGAGDLKVLTSEGMGNKRRADRRMVRMFSSIADALHIDLGRADYSWDETDATPAMQRSVRVNTLMGVSTDGVPAHSHTSIDEPEYLDDQQIANVADLIAELIRRS